MPKKILAIIAPENFRDEECFQTREELESREMEVTIASRKTGEIKGMLGGTANADITIDQVKPEEYDALVLVGGVGAKAYFDDEKVQSIAKSFASAGKPLAAICIAPTILANAGLLKGKKATVWQDPGLIENLKQKGAEYTGEALTVDGKIITANGPGAARNFGRKIAEVLG